MMANERHATWMLEKCVTHSHPRDHGAVTFPCGGDTPLSDLRLRQRHEAAHVEIKNMLNRTWIHTEVALNV